MFILCVEQKEEKSIPNNYFAISIPSKLFVIGNLPMCCANSVHVGT